MLWSRCAVLFALVGIILTTILSVHAQDMTIYITTQRFEKGLMVWRSDNSTIYVLGNNGQAVVFGSPSYTNLPDNPIFGTPPSRLRPLFGFGKVWGNNKNVRDLIGWPVLDEIGFKAWMLIQNKTTYIKELDNTLIEIKPDGTWMRSVPSPIPTPTPITCSYPLIYGGEDGGLCANQPITTRAAYQSYERGFTIWLAHSGDVWVFLSDRSRWLHFAQSDYAGLADAPTEQPPVQPINGFGRVWYHLKDFEGQSLKTVLGWATGGEIGYTANTQLWGRTSHVHIYLSLPDGRIVDAYSGLAGIMWSWAK